MLLLGDPDSPILLRWKLVRRGWMFCWLVPFHQGDGHYRWTSCLDRRALLSFLGSRQWHRRRSADEPASTGGFRPVREAAKETINQIGPSTVAACLNLPTQAHSPTLSQLAMRRPLQDERQSSQPSTTLRFHPISNAFCEIFFLISSLNALNSRVHNWEWFRLESATGFIALKLPSERYSQGIPRRGLYFLRSIWYFRTTKWSSD